jgi:hypothetical protein
MLLCKLAVKRLNTIIASAENRYTAKLMTEHQPKKVVSSLIFIIAKISVNIEECTT